VTAKATLLGDLLACVLGGVYVDMRQRRRLSRCRPVARFGALVGSPKVTEGPAPSPWQAPSRAGRIFGSR